MLDTPELIFDYLINVAETTHTFDQEQIYKYIYTHFSGISIFEEILRFILALIQLYAHIKHIYNNAENMMSFLQIM